MAAAAVAGAGCLAIELVWMRILALTFGSASVAAGSVVAALMLGMAIGSALAARRPSTGLGIVLGLLAGVSAISAPALRVLGSLGPVAVAAAAIFVTVTSIPMGMIVPLLVARAEGDGLRAAGVIYAANTLGSAAAVLLSGFVLLPRLGNQWTLWAASGGLALLAAVSRGKRVRAEEAMAQPDSRLPRSAKIILLLYGISAFAAMSSEMGWIRALVLSIGSSTYAYTIVLGVYIAGLGLGSALAARYLGARAFGALQMLAALACLLVLHLLGRLPEFFGRVFHDRVTSLATFSWTALLSTGVALLPPTVLVGACYPVAVRWLGTYAGPSRASGLLLAAATAGSMLGALLASFFSIPWVGVQGTLAMALFLHAIVGSICLSFLGKRRRILPPLGAAAVLGLLFLRSPWDVRAIQSGPYIYGQDRAGRGDSRQVLFAKEDRVASVAVFGLPDGNRVLRIDGKTDASLSQVDLVTQLLTAHLPLAIHGAPERIALVGLGSGMTLASCLKYDPREVDCIEISPSVVRASRLFDEETGGPLADPRVKLHVADARTVLRSIDGKFDVILNEPSNLWIAGMAGLFTREFYQACERHLADHGLMGQWLHAYGVTDDTFRDAVATFHEVFPYVTVWELWISGDYLFVGSTSPYPVQVAKLEHALGLPKIADDLRRIDVSTPGGLLSDLVATSEDLKDLSGARIQTDDGLHLEFIAPLGFYGRKRLPPLSYLPAMNVGNVARVVQGCPVGWAAARDFLRRGIRAVLEDRPVEERMDFFRRALQQFPEDRQARLMLEDQVDQLVRKGEWEKIPPESRRYAEGRLHKIAAMKLHASPPGPLIEEYRRALAASPDHEAVLTGLADALLAAGAIAEADDVSARAVGREPDSARARLIRGKVYAAQRKYDEALAEWEVARRLAPESPQGREADRLIKGK